MRIFLGRLENCTLLILSLRIFAICMDSSYLYYLNPRFMPLSLLAGFLGLIIALLGLYRGERKGHWLRLALLVLLLGAFLFVPNLELKLDDLFIKDL